MHPNACSISGYQGVSLNVWDYGGDGPPLLLLHCTGTHGRIWDPVVKHLLPAFRVLSLDTRGHGDSAKPIAREAYAWIHSGRDVLAVADALGFGSTLLAAGHSGGGAYAAYAQWLRPGVFARMALIDPVIGPASVFAGERPLAKKARQRRDVFKNLETARTRFASKPPMNTWTAAALTAYVDYGLMHNSSGHVELKCPKQVEAWLYELGGASDLYEHLHELRGEILLLSGELSDVHPLVALQRQRLPQSTLEIVEGAGHFLPQEHPEITAKHLKHWFLGASAG